MTHQLILFTHQTCHSKLQGPILVKSALQGMEGVRFEEKDLIRNSQDAKAAGAQMSPTLVLDQKVLCVGIPCKDELRRMIKEQLKKS